MDHLLGWQESDIMGDDFQPEPEFRPPMSEVVQSLVRLMQRATLGKKKPGEEELGTDMSHDSIDDGSL